MHWRALLTTNRVTDRTLNRHSGRSLRFGLTCCTYLTAAAECAMNGITLTALTPLSSLAALIQFLVQSTLDKLRMRHKDWLNLCNFSFFDCTVDVLLRWEIAKLVLACRWIKQCGIAMHFSFMQFSSCWKLQEVWIWSVSCKNMVWLLCMKRKIQLSVVRIV